ncbi:REP-associated tyrosine transposase [Pseudoalteromonas arctica]|uniref:Transposase n=1 Tax=Pseudoalteromonas arctica TaxID=394751 RepID=A0A7Y0DSV9_9GAMM|nr:transposase [Pseudoalteromonas arctica]NMM41025.1 transposase [Pseudoalteromonas arctica]
MNNAYRLRKGRVSSANHFYSITIVTHQRQRFFTGLAINRQIIKHMQQLEQQQLIKSIAFVLMPDHLHWQFQLLENTTLASVIRTFKGRTATTCRKYGIQKLWQKGYYDHLIRDENDLINQARYIVANPLRAKLVTTVANYPYWDCIYLP